MADAVYTVQTQSYVKLMLHAAKRPASSVCGLLLGQRQGKRVLVSDAAPLFHHEAPLAPMLEVACAMVDAYCRKRCSTIEIVGFYYATSGDSVSASTSGLSYFAEKVADKLEQICSQACVVLVNNEQVATAELDKTKGLQLVLKDGKRGWIRAEKGLQVADGAAELLSEGLQQSVQKHVVDFEEHLEDPSKDWRNPHVVDLLKLHV